MTRCRAGQGHDGRKRRPVRRIAVAIVLALVGGLTLTVAMPAPVAAHTGLESSQPSDGDMLSEPVSEILLEFNRQVEPVPDGLTVFDELGLEHRPDSLSSADGQIWHMLFETPLTGGQFDV